MLEQIQETAAYLKSKMHTHPETAIILGTGLGSLAGEITEKTGELINIPVAQEVCLEKMYNVDGTVNTVAKDNENTEVEIQRLKHLLATSQVSNIEGGKTIVTADTIHFTNRLSNSLELIKQAHDVITPVPVNYKNACLSGWVE